MSFFRRMNYYLKSILEMLVHFKNWVILWPVFFKKGAQGVHIVHVRRPPVRIKVRGRMDVWAVKETFLDRFYTRHGVEVEDGWTIMDVGAGMGDFSIYAAYGRPNAVVYAYEPFIESYQLLIQNITLNAIDNVIAFQRALWGESGLLALDLSGGEPLQIISQGVDASLANQGKVTVKALSLQDCLEGQGIERVDLMKLDCEGAEYEILLQASRQTLEKIERLVMEYHDIGEDHNHQILTRFLEDEGYSVICVENLVHEDLGYLYATR